jgi:serine/threonine protein kinase
VEFGEKEFYVKSRYLEMENKGVGDKGMVCDEYENVKKKNVDIKKMRSKLKNVKNDKREYRELKIMKIVNKKNIIGMINDLKKKKYLEEFKDVYLVMELMDENICKVIKMELENERM